MELPSPQYKSDLYSTQRIVFLQLKRGRRQSSMLLGGQAFPKQEASCCFSPHCWSLAGVARSTSVLAQALQNETDQSSHLNLLLTSNEFRQSSACSVFTAQSKVQSDTFSTAAGGCLCASRSGCLIQLYFRTPWSNSWMLLSVDATPYTHPTTERSEEKWGCESKQEIKLHFPCLYLFCVVKCGI